MNNAPDLLAALSDSLTSEQLQLSILQGQIAAEISMRRQALGLSQKELAEKLGVTQSLVSRWERAESNFNLSTIVKISSALGLRLQSPVVPSPVKSYTVGTSNIIKFTPDWKTTAYAPSLSVTTGIEGETDLIEM